MDVKVAVYPEEGNFPAIARALLDVADHPGQVRSITWPRAGFEVPEHVFERFELVNKLADEPDADQAAPVRRRPGRPRKNPVSDTEFAAAMSQATPKAQDDSDASKEE